MTWGRATCSVRWALVQLHALQPWRTVVFLWVLGLTESQQWACGRATEDLEDVMREGGQGGPLLVNGTTCCIFTLWKSWSYAQEAWSCWRLLKETIAVVSRSGMLLWWLLVHCLASTQSFPGYRWMNEPFLHPAPFSNALYTVCMLDHALPTLIHSQPAETWLQIFRC